jgi:hypothetical protein
MIVLMPAVVAGPGGDAVLDGVLERVTFANPETGYTIARIAPERGGADLVTAVGPLLGAQIGEFLRLRGRWSSHPKYGRQFALGALRRKLHRWRPSGGPPDLGPPHFLAGFVRADRVVLADRPFDCEGVIGDVGGE